VTVKLSANRPFLPVVKLPGAQSAQDVLAEGWLRELYQGIADTMDTERSQQTKIGISEIGHKCQKCLARKLSGLYPDDGGSPEDGWKAQVGTMGHAYLEEHFGARWRERVVHPGESTPRLSEGWDGQAPTDERPWFYLEHTVHVDSYRGMELDGHCDLYIRGATFGMVVDWKFPGPPKMKEFAAGKPGQVYEIQQNTYGFGWALQGFPVTHVCLFALPREGNLDDASPNLARFEPERTIERLELVHQLIDVAEMAGWPSVISTAPAATFCYDCKRYNKLEQRGFLSAMFE
jgi:hypothetical protein